ncbi:MAG: universal stress protein [Desulfobacterales bacterium]|nr:universal stress protein [Desulfobacterales bacterium]
MNPEDRPGKPVRVRRILVPLDESAHSRAALEAAAHLASALGSEISGLYVEDADLLEFCRYPFAWEIGIYRSRRLSRDEVERDFRTQAERLRQMMALTAAQSRVSWNFSVRRGRVISEILEQTASADLTVIGRLGRSLLQSSTGSTVRRLVEEGSAMILILGRGLRMVSPVLTLYTGSELSGLALGAAVDLSLAVGRKTEILIPADTESAYQKLRDRVLSAASETPGSEGLHLRFRRIRTNTAAGLVTVMQAEYRRPLVLPADALDSDPQVILDLISRVHNPILLVRQGGKKS